MLSWDDDPEGNGGGGWINFESSKKSHWLAGRRCEITRRGISLIRRKSDNLKGAIRVNWEEDKRYVIQDWRDKTE